MGERLLRPYGGCCLPPCRVDKSTETPREKVRNRILLQFVQLNPRAGVNLPARRVVVRDLTRWDDGLGRPLPRMEVHQMLGRAGRRYDARRCVVDGSALGACR